MDFLNSYLFTIKKVMNKMNVNPYNAIFAPVSITASDINECLKMNFLFKRFPNINIDVARTKGACIALECNSPGGLACIDKYCVISDS